MRQADIVVESAAELSVEDMASRVVEALKARPDVLEV
jgi:shikimate kinase